MNPWGSNPSTKRRDKLFIIAEILEISREGSLKTQIMYRANLSFTQLNDYLKFTLRIGLLEKVLVNGKDTYRASIKGLDFLQRYNEITELIKGDDENNGKNGIKIPPQHLLKRTQNAP
jgi:predicted transcriptional regulator